jgi:hypothetical protein
LLSGRRCFYPPQLASPPAVGKARYLAAALKPERPFRIPRSIWSLKAAPEAGAVLWQPQVRLPNGFGWVLDGFGSALAGAAATAPEPRTITAPTIIFVMNIMTLLIPCNLHLERI